MSEQDSSASASQIEEDFEGEVEDEGEQDGKRRTSPTPSLSALSSSLRAVIRIKQKYQAMKKRRQEMGLVLGGAGPLTGAPARASPKIFTFDGLTPSAFSSLPYSNAQKKKKRRRRRVLFPNGVGRKAVPKQEHSRAKYCLYLLCAIVFLQVSSQSELFMGGGGAYGGNVGFPPSHLIPIGQNKIFL